MNIWGVMPNIAETANVKSAQKSTSSQQNYKGPSFVESMHDIAKSANLEVAKGNTAAYLEFNRAKKRSWTKALVLLMPKKKLSTRV